LSVRFIALARRHWRTQPAKRRFYEQSWGIFLASWAQHVLEQSRQDLHSRSNKSLLSVREEWWKV
jgi:hypothetical protein